MYSATYSGKETYIMKILDKHDICPNIINISENPLGLYDITMKKYDCSLFNIPFYQRYKFYGKIKDLLVKMHNVGVLWVDITEDNILINDDENDIRFVNFENSIEKDYWNHDLSKRWFDKDVNNVDDYMMLELNEIKIICNIIDGKNMEQLEMEYKNKIMDLQDKLKKYTLEIYNKYDPTYILDLINKKYPTIYNFDKRPDLDNAYDEKKLMLDKLQNIISDLY